MSIVYKCDRCGQEMSGRHFLVNFFWKPCGDTEHEPQLYTEKELCPDCEEKISDLINGAKNTEQTKGGINIEPILVYIKQFPYRTIYPHRSVGNIRVYSVT